MFNRFIEFIVNPMFYNFLFELVECLNNSPVFLPFVRFQWFALTFNNNIWLKFYFSLPCILIEFLFWFEIAGFSLLIDGFCAFRFRQRIPIEIGRSRRGFAAIEHVLGDPTFLKDHLGVLGTTIATIRHRTGGASCR